MSTKRKIYMYALTYKAAPKYEIVSSFNNREITRWHNEDVRYLGKSSTFENVSPIQASFINIPTKSDKKVKK